MAELIDLRSDTVTLPTPAMRKAMAEAEVGDDVYGEDPTINRLEEMSADLCGKEAGLFVASGSMGNLVALLTHCGRGHEVLVGATTHMFVQEQGGMAALGGIQLFVIGLMGEYVARIYEEVKRRPLYLVNDVHGINPDARAAPSETVELSGVAPTRTSDS